MTDRSTAVLEALRRSWDDDVSYVRRPVAWVRERAREYPWSAQRRIIESVRDNRYTAVPSAHDLGKSFIASRTVAWWNDVHAPGTSFVVSTAPSAAQVSAILWREIAEVHAKAELRGRINRAGYPQWFEGHRLVGYGRKPSDYEESAFQGIHARYVLVVIDEAGGVSQQLYNAIDALATNEYARVLAIGNPDDPGSHFASICKPGSGWNTIQLDGLRSPNMTHAQIIGDDPDNPRLPLLAALMRSEGIEFSDEDIPAAVRPMLVTPLWVEERIARWCGISEDQALAMPVDELGDFIRSRAAGSSLFQAKVRGVFPTSTSTGVIPLGWVQQAQNRWKDWVRGDKARGIAPRDVSRMSTPSAKIIGVDVAYGGEDETVAAVRYGNIITELLRYRLADTVETADLVSSHCHETGSMVVVDVIGIGAGVYDTLRRYRNAPDGHPSRIEARPIPFNAAASSTRTDKIGEFKFRNDRAAAWWKLRELLDPSRGSTLMIPDDERLTEELTAVKYNYLAGGIIQIESKDDIRKRLGRSTDSADAVVQAFWPTGMTEEQLNPRTPREGREGHRAARRRSSVVDYASADSSGLVAAGYSGGVYEPFDEADFYTDSHSSTLG